MEGIDITPDRFTMTMNPERNTLCKRSYKHTAYRSSEAIAQAYLLKQLTRFRLKICWGLYGIRN